MYLFFGYFPEPQQCYCPNWPKLLPWDMLQPPTHAPPLSFCLKGTSYDLVDMVRFAVIYSLFGMDMTRQLTKYVGR